MIGQKFGRRETMGMPSGTAIPAGTTRQRMKPKTAAMPSPWKSFLLLSRMMILLSVRRPVST